LIGVIIGCIYAFIFSSNTYRRHSIKEKTVGHIKYFYIDLALNVSFLNKKRFMDMLDNLPGYSEVEINGRTRLIDRVSRIHMLQPRHIKTYRIKDNQYSGRGDY
jgi:hypothetical protein